MHNFQIIPTKDLTLGFYKILSLNYPTATVEFRANLKNSTKKGQFQVNLTALFNPISNRPAMLPSTLIRKIIEIVAIEKVQGDIKSASWRILDRALLDQLRVAANPVKGLKDLTAHDMLNAYDQLKEELKDIPLSEEEVYGINDYEDQNIIDNDK